MPRPSRPRRLLRVLGAAVVLLAGAPAAAQATTRYVDSVGANAVGDCTNQNLPCPFGYGVGVAQPGDTVLVGFGTYDLGTSLIVPPGIVVRGIGAGYSIVNVAKNGPSIEVGTGTTLRGLSINGTLDGIHFKAGTSVIGVDARFSGGTACTVEGPGVSFVNSMCVSTRIGTDTDAAVDLTGIGTGQAVTSFRNSTLIGPARAIRYANGPLLDTATTTQDLDLVNVIAATRQPATCVIQLPAKTRGAIRFHSTTSSHPDISTPCAGGGGHVEFTITGRLEADPAFVDAAGGDYHEAAGSPTRGAGTVDAANGALDLAGVPRTAAGFTDIGAYQYIVAPAISAAPPTDLTATTATLHASIDNHGFESSTSFRYGVADAGENIPDATIQPQSLSPQLTSVPLTGLTPNTTYRYVACTLLQSFYPCLSEQTFATPPALPAVSGTAARDVGQTTATLGAAVNPGNDATSARFAYGPTAALGTDTASVPLAKGLADQPLGAALTGLTPGTSYSAQVVATNGAGTTRGPVVTFTTAAAAGGGSGGGGGSGSSGGSGGGAGGSGGTSGGGVKALPFALIGKPKVKAGVITLSVRVPAGGSVRATATIKAGRRTVTYAAKTARPAKAGTLKLVLTPTRAGKAARRKARRLSAKLALRFVPTARGGKAQTLKASARVR